MKNILIALLLLTMCAPKEETVEIDVQGHRGARGLLPENSIPAFLLATELGVKTLELDLVVSKDSQLVVSHEPYFSSVFCYDVNGDTIPSDSVINMYRLTYEEIRQFDCGTKSNPRFPQKQSMKAFKPRLVDVFDAVESRVVETGRTPVRYNIELKTTLATDSTFHPSPGDFSDLVFDLVSEKNLWDKVNIQSFDFRTLQYFRKKYPAVKLALLIENELSWEKNIDSLGFIPEIYSCYYPLLSQQNVKAMQDKGMEVIPWTVNDVEEMQQLIKYGVDGIITDYPDRAMKLVKNK